MKPFSAGYYIKNNKSRSAIVIFMMFITTCMLIVGNYLGSLWWFYDAAGEYDSKIVVVGAVTTDTDYRDWWSFVNDLKNDENLIPFGRTGRGCNSVDVKTTLGFQTGIGGFVFNSAEDLQQAFDLLGIKYDCTGLEDQSLVISDLFAKNIKMKVGDLTEDKIYKLQGTYDDPSFLAFRIYHEPSEDSYYRYNIMSEKMSGEELRKYVIELIGDRKIKVEEAMTTGVNRELAPIRLIFYASLIILSVILAVTLNSVVTGQYVKREYEFGVYRALGVSRGRIRRKVAAELFLMDLIAVVGGVVLLTVLTFLLNELVYLPRGQYLPYFTQMGVIGTIISNILVLVPMVFFKGRRMSRMDVTEF